MIKIKHVELSQEYEGDIYCDSDHDSMGPYSHGCSKGLFGFISLTFCDLYTCIYVNRAVSRGDRSWGLEKPEEYVMPKEFLM